MRSLFILLAVALPFLSLPASPVVAQGGPIPGVATMVGGVDYRISFPNARHHEAEIVAEFVGVGPGPLRLRMSRTSPGRYALHEFAKNVYDVRFEGAGPVEVDRPNPHEWVVSNHGGRVEVRYTLYADRADGTYAQVDHTHAHLNIPATFMFAPDHMSAPVRVEIDPGDRPWSVATQLVPTRDRPFEFGAPDVHYFMDSPILVGDLDVRERALPNGQTLRVAMHHLGTDAELDEYAEHTWAISEELAAVFGGWPDFDAGTYTFLATYVPWASGDGMEHRNSTVLSSSSSLRSNMVGLLGTVAHEFVHAWNVERIRPASLEPFDFETANMSRELWFGEGFTSYLDDVALVRAGVVDEAAFLRRVAGTASAAIRARGRRFFSPVEMSMQAPFVDAATSVDPQNRVNTFLSYYTWGAAIGLGLDLTLQSRFDTSIEALMQEMWRRHGEPEVPYTVADVESALAAVTSDAAFAADFFDRFVRGRDVPEYAELFRTVGARFFEPSADEAWATGARVTELPGGLGVQSNTLAGDPLYERGVDRGDVITRIDGRPATMERWEMLLDDSDPGDRVELVVESRGEARTIPIVLQSRPGHTAQVDSAAGAEAAARRAEWIRPRR